MAKNNKKLVDDINVKDIVEEALTEQEHPQDDLPLSEEGKKKEQIWKIRKNTGLTGISFRKASDLDPLEDMLTQYYMYCKAGQYEKIRPDKNMSVDIGSFVKTYKPETLDLNTQEYNIARMLIEIGKSIYEFDYNGYANHENNPLLTDAQYRELVSAWNMPKHASVEPTGIVPVNKGGKQKMPLRYPTLSNNLEKTYRIGKNDEVPTGVKEEDSVESFLDRIYNKIGLKDNDKLELLVTPKLDGVSVNTTISEGKFRSPATRGDATSNLIIKGLDGYNIISRSSAALTDTMKKQLRTANAFGAQYEAFVLKSDVAAAAQAIGTTYINCRSAASGIINRMTADSKTIGLSKYLRFYPINTEKADTLNYQEGLNLLDLLCVVPKDMLPRTPISGAKAELIKKLKTMFAEYSKVRPTLSYDIDGMVISVVKDEYQEKIGRDGRTNQWQLAMKFPPESSEGVVTGISVSYGNKGRRSIMLDLEEPAVIDGVSYPQVQILSTREFAKMHLKVGSRIEIVRTSDVIPAFASILADGDGEEIKLPETCPACGKKLQEGKDGHLRCVNDDCPANIVGLVTNAFIVLGLENYNAAFAEKLMSKAGVKRVVDLLDLSDNKLKDAGITGKIEDEFLTAFGTAVQSAPDYVLLAALGLPKIGKERARAFMAAIDFNKLKDMTVEEVAKALTEKAGAKTMAKEYAETLVNNKDDIARFIAMTAVKTDFSNMITIGHTEGDIPKELRDKIIAHGWAITDGTKFDVLVTGNPSGTTRKAKLAAKKGTPVITMKQLEANIDNLDNIKAMIVVMKESKKEIDKANKPKEDKKPNVIALPAAAPVDEAPKQTEPKAEEPQKLTPKDVDDLKAEIREKIVEEKKPEKTEDPKPVEEPKVVDNDKNHEPEEPVKETPKEEPKHDNFDDVKIPNMFDDIFDYSKRAKENEKAGCYKGTGTNAFKDSLEYAGIRIGVAFHDFFNRF